MLTLSLILNIVVLIPVCGSLAGDADWTRAAYGEPTPARAILLSIYAAILAVSALALVAPMPQAAAGLLLAQVVYKAISPFAARTWRNPVILSNLGIAAFHAATLARIGLAAG